MIRENYLFLLSDDLDMQINYRPHNRDIRDDEELFAVIFFNFDLDFTLSIKNFKNRLERLYTSFNLEYSVNMETGLYQVLESCREFNKSKPKDAGFTEIENNINSILNGIILNYCVYDLLRLRILLRQNSLRISPVLGIGEFKDILIKNLDGKNLEYMSNRIGKLQEIIPIALQNDDDTLYIF